MSNKSLIALIAGVVVAVAVWSSVYVVQQTERAVMLRFGRVVEPDVKPGLHFKIPYVNTVRKFDGRLLTLDSPTQRFLTLEKKAVMVDAYAKWRVSDAERFYTATSGMKQIADERLSRRLEAGLRDQFGKRTLHEVVSGERDALMGDITASLNRMAQKELGIEVVDVRVKAIDLPKEVNRSVFERMSTEREREAREHRAKGRELAEGIRADADRQRRVLLAEAYRESEETRGDGDAKRRRSTPRPTLPIRSSTPSPAVSRLIARALRTRRTCWCSIRAASSSAIWKKLNRKSKSPAGGSARRRNRVIMGQPGNPGFFASARMMYESHVAGIRQGVLSVAGAGRHPSIPVPAWLARRRERARAPWRPQSETHRAGQHAARHRPSLLHSLKCRPA